MKKLLIVVAAVAVLGLAMAAVGGAVAVADEGEKPASTFLAKVAGKLGISEDKLKEALQQAELEIVDQAVANGRIPQDRAEQLKERIEEGARPFFLGKGQWRPFKGRLGQHLLFLSYKAAIDTTAQLLNMERAKVVAELREGKSLAQITTEHGVGRQALIDALVKDATDRIKERTDKLIESLPDRMGKLVDHKFPGRKP